MGITSLGLKSIGVSDIGTTKHNEDESIDSKIHRNAKFVKRNISELDEDDLAMLGLAITKELISRLDDNEEGN